MTTAGQSSSMRVAARLFFALSAVVLASHMLFAQRATQRPVRSAALPPPTRQGLIAALSRASDYLRQQQQKDGRWESDPGITALVAEALLRQPRPASEAAAETTKRALDVLVSLQKPDGGIYERDQPDYITSVAITALVAAGRATDRPAIEKARQFLVDQQLDEADGVQPSDKFYGGIGYGGTTVRNGGRADVISLEYGLRAMKEAGLPKDHAAWGKALTFLRRAQNDNETNDQGWATTDGGFVTYPGFSLSKDGELHSYGSASFAGLLSYTHANLTRNNPEVQSVLKWLYQHYSVDENPGLGQRAVYYYYFVLARGLQITGHTFVADPKGRQHNWREELGRKLMSLQHPDGYWVNSVPDEMQDNKVLVTALSMSAIETILQ